MQLRTIALICSVVGLCYSSFATALGLGEITLKSQFNQPLFAEIRLLKVRDLSEEEIIASLASREDFRRAGVDREFILTRLQFEIVLDNPNNPFIRVTTRQPVTEPYLNFLVELQWPSGRLLREYTLLLDLPVFNESAPSAVNAPSSGAVATPVAPAPQVQTVQPRPRPQSAPATAPPTRTVAPAPVDRYRVRSGDTLWEIAEQVRPDGSVTVTQTMIAIQQANPEAFIGGNINQLRNGRVLRIPDTTEINSISYNQAVAAVREQNRSWSSRSTQKPVLTSSDTSATAPGSSGSPAGRLTLGSADSGSGDVKAAGVSGAGESLQNELSLAQEELSRSRRENSELNARVAELESQIETMQKLIEVTNDQLKALELATQQDGSEAPGATDPATVESSAAEPTEGTVAEADATQEPVPDTTVVDEDTTVGAEEPVESTTLLDTEEQPGESAVVAEESVEETIAEENVAETTESVAEAPVVATPAADTKPGFMDFVKRNIFAIGGGIVALLLAIMLLLRLREKPDDNDFGEFDIAEQQDDDMLAPADDDDLFSEDSELEETAAAIEDDFDAAPVEAQTEDVVAEADIYVSLGQEDKAIELLQKEIHENPDNADARLGLLKVYAKTQNISAFDEQYAQLLPLGNTYINDQATALRQEFDNATPFDTDQYSLDSDTLDLDSLDTDTVTETADAEAVEDNLDFDLNLDEPSAIAEDSITEAQEEGLDFDVGDLSLDLDEDPTSTSTDSALDDGLDLGDEDDLSLDLEFDEEFTTDLIDDSLDDADSDTNLDLELNSDYVDSLSGDETVAAVDDVDDDMELDLDSDLELDFDISADEPDGENADSGLSLIDEAPAVASDTAADIAPELEFSLDDSATADDAADELPAFDLTLDDDGQVSLDDTVAVDSVADLEVTDTDADFDLDLPPEGIDIASLDQEIDQMTAELDKDLALDSDNDALSESVDMVDDLALTAENSVDDLIEEAETLDLEAPVEDTLDTDAPATDIDLDLDALDDDTDSAAMGVLANSELTVDESTVEKADDTSSVTVDSSSSSEETLASEDDLDFLEASDEVATKLDLARAYLDMGDREGAEDILGEVMEEGNAQQRDQAQELMQQI